MAARGRRPGRPETREQILDAARELFAERGYQRATIRAVAARAGVDPALVHHYFGTKSDLLVAALQLPVDPAALLAGVADHGPRAGAELARRLLTVWETAPHVRQRWVALLRTGLANDQAATMLTELLSRSVLPVLDELTAADHRPLRASLVGSHLSGLLLGRYVLRVPDLVEAPVDHLVIAVGPVLQHYLSGELRLPAPARPSAARPTRRRSAAGRAVAVGGR